MSVPRIRVALACAAAVALVSPVVAPADAAVVPGVSAACSAGDPNVADASVRNPITGNVLIRITADCTDSSPSFVGRAADTVLRVISPGTSISSLNQAIAIGPLAGTDATITGRGFTTAIAALGGSSTSNARNTFAAAITAATGPGVATSSALLGIGVSLAIGVPIVAPNRADTNALPGGIAIASANHPLAGRTADATALLGIASATATADPDDGAVCTALYGTARVADRNGANIDSCTSVGFMFQRRQQNDGPVWYSVKDPTSVRAVAPIGDGLTDLIGAVGNVVDIPPAAVDVLSAAFVPEFTRDIVRVSFDDGFRIGTDLLGGLGSTSGSTAKRH
ncbi:hypothetical protein nbrc107696_06920 [Gordonia spumicola]|uniref:Uncharacterized protein n=1 Tax=Gordonia spumicola TaxID=589161 RepID=A0A7I9V4A6_9ACTN|nr:hypothetical protein [Gordonia spumicola]GEE00246.1 hypothetical protein nbrc107696_06920 [Gordonia spumicola]